MATNNSWVRIIQKCKACGDYIYQYHDWTNTAGVQDKYTCKNINCALDHIYYTEAELDLAEKQKKEEEERIKLLKFIHGKLIEDSYYGKGIVEQLKASLKQEELKSKFKIPNVILTQDMGITLDAYKVAFEILSTKLPANTNITSGPRVWQKLGKAYICCKTCGAKLSQHADLSFHYNSPTAYYDRFKCKMTNCKEFSIEKTQQEALFGVTTMQKVVQYSKLYGGDIIEFKFLSYPKKGFFKEQIQPMVDFTKGIIPSTEREYDPATYSWQVSKAYWQTLVVTFEAVGWTLKEQKESDRLKDHAAHVKVDEKYAENFYHNAQPVTTVESKESIHDKLEAFLGKDFTKREYRAFAYKYHPDINPSPDAAAKMAEVNRLWSIYNAVLTGVQNAHNY